LTRVVNLLGADLASDLIPAGIGNTLGHWESRAVQDLHNRIFSELRSDIYSPVNFSQAWFESPSANAWVDRIEALVRQEYADSTLFVLKDPRIVLFVPLWIAALNRLAIDPYFVIPFRHPLAVAASLEARERQLESGNALPRAQGMALWLRYTLAAEKYTRGQKRAFVSFEMLLADWRRELTRIGGQLDVRWPRFGAADAEIDRFLDADQRDHGHTVPADDRARMHQVILNVYEALEAAVTDPQTTPAAFGAAAEMTARAEEVLGAYALIKESEVASLRAELEATRRRHADETATAHRTFEAEISARDLKIAEAARYAKSLAQSLDEATSYAKSLERSRDEAKAYAGSLEQSRDEAKAYAGSLEQSRDEAKAYASSLERSRDEALQHAKAQEMRADELARALETARGDASSREAALQQGEASEPPRNARE
jgi:hypothetical protein